MKRRAVLVGVCLALGCARQAHVVERAFVPATGGDDLTPRWDDSEIVHSNGVGSAQTARGVFWSLWLPAGLALALAAAKTRQHRRGARLEAESAKGTALTDGPAVVQGVVETDGADAITVTITQARHEFRDKNGNAHVSWKERRREVLARPFTVKRDDGRVVRVEPDASVLLRDALDPAELMDDDTRLRRIRLRAGERVWASGVLSGASAQRAEGAYRAAPSTATLRPQRFARMVVSTEAPGAYHTDRAEFHRGWVKVALVVLALTQGVLLWNTTLQTVSGRGVTLAIERTRAWDEWVKPKNQSGRWVRHCAVSGRAAPGDALEEHEVSCGFYACVEVGQCRTLPTRRALLTGDTLREAGRGPVSHFAQLVFAALIGWVTLLAYLVSARSTRPWYAGGKVNDAG